MPAELNSDLSQFIRKKNSAKRKRDKADKNADSQQSRSSLSAQSKLQLLNAGTGTVMPKPSQDAALRAIGEVVSDANSGAGAPGIASIQENQRESQLSCISITETDAAVVAILPVQVDLAEPTPEPMLLPQQPSRSTILSSKEELIKSHFGR